MATEMTLVVYIDKTLLQHDPTTHKPNLGNLTLARKVQGVANVIFQGRTTSDFSEANTFTWSQSYKIGATMSPPGGGAFVQADGGKVLIAAGYMCDWMGPDGSDMQYVPTPVQGDSGFLQNYPAEQGKFGSKHQPDGWYNSIWCSTSNGEYSSIYAETPGSFPPGMLYRGYLVENNYQVSWEADNFHAGIFAGSWTSPWSFSMEPSNNPQSNFKYISWGYGADPSTGPMWYDYGMTDPGQHDPSKSIPPSSASDLVPLGAEQARFPQSSLAPGHLDFRLGWTASYYSESAKPDLARTVFDYIQRSTGGWLNISNVYIGAYLSATATIKDSTSFEDFIAGGTEQERIRFYMKGIVAGISPRYAPDNLDWNYEFAYNRSAQESARLATVGGPVRQFIRLTWTNLKAPVISLANASAKYISGLVQADLQKQLNAPSVSVSYESAVTVDGNGKTVTSKMTIQGLPANGQGQAWTMLQKWLKAEQARTSALAGHPEVPTPDPVTGQQEASEPTTVSANPPHYPYPPYYPYGPLPLPDTASKSQQGYSDFHFPTTVAAQA